MLCLASRQPRTSVGHVEASHAAVLTDILIVLGGRLDECCVELLGYGFAFGSGDSPVIRQRTLNQRYS